MSKLKKYRLQTDKKPLQIKTTHKGSEISSFVTVVSLKEFCGKKIGNKTNPRDPLSRNGKFYLSIKDSVCKAPEMFVHKHMGFTVMVNSIREIDGGVEFDIDESDKNSGLANGSSSYSAAGDVFQSISDGKMQCENADEALAKVTFIVIPNGNSDVDLIVSDVTCDQNTGNKVHLYTLCERRGLFQPIKNALKETHFYDKIRFRQNSDTNIRNDIRKRDEFRNSNIIPVELIMAYVDAFNSEKYPMDRILNLKDDGFSKSFCAVKHDSEVIKDLYGSVFHGERNEEHQIMTINQMNKCFGVIEDLLFLQDHIHSIFVGDLFNQTSKKEGEFNVMLRRLAIKESAKKDEKTLGISEKGIHTSKFSVGEKFLVPLTVSVIPLVNEVDGKFSFDGIDLVEKFDEIRPDLFNQLNNMLEKSTDSADSISESVIARMAIRMMHNRFCRN